MSSKAEKLRLKEQRKEEKIECVCENSYERLVKFIENVADINDTINNLIILYKKYEKYTKRDSKYYSGENRENIFCFNCKNDCNLYFEFKAVKNNLTYHINRKTVEITFNDKKINFPIYFCEYLIEKNTNTDIEYDLSTLNYLCFNCYDISKCCYCNSYINLNKCEHLKLLKCLSVNCDNKITYIDKYYNKAIISYNSSHAIRFCFCEECLGNLLTIYKINKVNTIQCNNCENYFKNVSREIIEIDEETYSGRLRIKYTCCLCFVKNNINDVIRKNSKIPFKCVYNEIFITPGKNTNLLRYLIKICKILWKNNPIETTNDNYVLTTLMKLPKDLFNYILKYIDNWMIPISKLANDNLAGCIEIF